MGEDRFPRSDAMRHRSDLQNIVAASPLRLEALAAVAALGLPDCWIAAGFVRDTVWDDAHGFGVRPPIGDVDVVWFDSARADAGADRAIEADLRAAMPQLNWSVKNQARMHERNGDAPYASVADAMRHWPETATAVAVRLRDDGAMEINAPFGLDDLFGLLLRPSPHFADVKRSIFDARVAAKQWVRRYPRLVLP